MTKAEPPSMAVLPAIQESDFVEGFVCPGCLRHYRDGPSHYMQMTIYQTDDDKIPAECSGSRRVKLRITAVHSIIPDSRSRTRRRCSLSSRCSLGGLLCAVMAGPPT